MYNMSIHEVMPTFWINFLLRENSVQLIRDAPPFCQYANILILFFLFPQFHLLLIPCQAEETPDTKQGKVMARYPPSLNMNELNSAEIERDSHGFWRDSFFFHLPLASQALNLALARMPGSIWGSWHTICVTITEPSIHHVQCKC